MSAVNNDCLEQELDKLDELVPQYAEQAFRDAYKKALATHGKVLEVKDNMLVETTADGQQRVIKKLPAGVKVKPGTRIALRVQKKPLLQ